MEHPPYNGSRVKLMISYDGIIQPRVTNLYDGHRYCYIGGDNKIITVDRNIKLFNLKAKLSTLTSSNVLYFKYQLPGKDLDALISVYNEEDLDRMMFKYDRICRVSPKPVRFRVFLFLLSVNNNNNNNNNNTSSDSLASGINLTRLLHNSAHVLPLKDSSPATSAPPPSSMMSQEEFPATSPDFAKKDTIIKTEMNEFHKLHVKNDEFEDILTLCFKRYYPKSNVAFLRFFLKCN